MPLVKAAVETAIGAHATHAGGKALDVGCGGQPFRAMLEAREYRYYGLDANPSAGVPVDFTCAIDGDLKDGPVMAAGPFDFILCTEVLEHVADWPRAFENLSALLAPRGKLVVTSPFFYYLHEEPYDFFRPTSHALAAFATRSGLIALENRQLGDAWDVLGTIMAGCRFRARDESMISRSTAWWLWKLRDFVFRRIARGAIRKRISFSGGLYISNLSVMEKPASPV